MDTNPTSWNYAAPIGAIYGPMSAKSVTAFVTSRAGGAVPTRPVVTCKRIPGGALKISGVGATDEGFVEACLTEWGIMR